MLLRDEALIGKVFAQFEQVEAEGGLGGKVGFELGGCSHRLIQQLLSHMSQLQRLDLFQQQALEGFSPLGILLDGLHLLLIHLCAVAQHHLVTLLNNLPLPRF